MLLIVLINHVILLLFHLMIIVVTKETFLFNALGKVRILLSRRQERIIVNATMRQFGRMVVAEC